MATQEQFEYFKYMYEEENERYKHLTDRGKIYISLITVYGAFLIFTIKDGALKGDLILIYIAATFSFVIAFASVLIALGMYSYETPTDPTEYIEELGDEPPTNEEFFDDRIIDLSVAYNRNVETNDKRVRMLLLSNFFLLVGLSLHATYFIVAAVVSQAPECSNAA